MTKTIRVTKAGALLPGDCFQDGQFEYKINKVLEHPGEPVTRVCLVTENINLNIPIVVYLPKERDVDLIVKEAK